MPLTEMVKSTTTVGTQTNKQRLTASPLPGVAFFLLVTIVFHDSDPTVLPKLHSLSPCVSIDSSIFHTQRHFDFAGV